MEMLKEILLLFGKILYIKRPVLLNGNYVNWTIVAYVDLASAEDCAYNLQSKVFADTIIFVKTNFNMELGEREKHFNKKIDEIAKAYILQKKKEKLVNNFINSHILINNNMGLNNTEVIVNEWLLEEAELRKKYFKILKIKKEEEQNSVKKLEKYLKYDDDTSGDLFYKDRTQWIIVRQKQKQELLNKSTNYSNDFL